MKTIGEVETIEVAGVKLDVYFEYRNQYGFEINAIEDIKGTQDLYYILAPHVLELIEKQLTDLYARRGWLYVDTV